MDRDEMSSLYRGLSIDASYHVSVHLAEGFQRTRLKCEKLSEDRRRTQSDGKSSHYLWQGELKTHNYLSPQSTKYQKKDHDIYANVYLNINIFKC